MFNFRAIPSPPSYTCLHIPSSSHTGTHRHWYYAEDQCPIFQMKNGRPERGLVQSSQLRSGIVTDETARPRLLSSRRKDFRQETKCSRASRVYWQSGNILRRDWVGTSEWECPDQLQNSVFVGFVFLDFSAPVPSARPSCLTTRAPARRLELVTSEAEQCSESESEI